MTSFLKKCLPLLTFKKCFTLISYRTRLTYLNAGLIRDLVLDLTPIKTLDFGDLYTCTASNSLGTVSATTLITGKCETIKRILFLDSVHISLLHSLTLNIVFSKWSKTE